MRIETYQLAEHGWVPNNERLPVIIYRNAIAPDHLKTLRAALNRLSRSMVGPPSGVMAFMTMIIITQRRMKFWALLQDRLAWRLAARMVGKSM
jgi:hypothetical protein